MFIASLTHKEIEMDRTILMLILIGTIAATIAFRLAELNGDVTKLEKRVATLETKEE